MRSQYLLNPFSQRVRSPLSLCYTWADNDGNDDRLWLRSLKAGYRPGRYQEMVLPFFLFTRIRVGTDVRT